MSHKLTKQDVIKEFQKLQGKFPTTDISRNFFRKNGTIREEQWNQYFGTFKELKAAAGGDLTRHQNRAKLDIAKHASVESYKQLNDEKRNFAGKYLKPNKDRFDTILVGSDVHDIECDPFWRFLFIQTAKRVQPGKIILNGDLFDLPEFGKYSVDPREWNVTGRIRWVHKFLEDLRKASPESEITLIEGNHEYRLLRHLSEATPALKSVLSDLHGFTVPKLLGLDEYEVNYVAPADLAAFNKSDVKAELSRNWMTIYDCLVAHHFPEGSRMGMPGWNGHHHKHEASTYYSAVFGSYEWHQLGSGHQRKASYCNGELWNNGFLLVHVDKHSKASQFEYVNTSGDHCVVGGIWYTREKI